MVKLISNIKYVSILIAIGLFSGFFTFLVLSLHEVFGNIITIFILPVIITMLFTLLIFLAIRKLKTDSKKIIKSLVMIFIMSYIIFQSVAIIFVMHTLETLILLIPMDLVLMSIPLYSLINRVTRQEGLEFNSDLTDRLKSMVGPITPEVYTKESRGTGMGGATGGDPWKIIIYKNTIERLNYDEMNMLLLEIYYKKITKINRKIVFVSFSLIAFLFDAYIIAFVVGVNVSVIYSPYIVGTEIGLLILIFVFPVIISSVLMKANITVDREIILHHGNRMALISLIEKENNYEPHGMMTQKQYDRIKRRQKKNANRRIKNIDSID